MKRVLFISSTGGHLSELLRLEPLFDEFDTSIVTEKSASYGELEKRFGKRLHYLYYGTRVKPLSYFFKLIANSFRSLRILMKIKPEVIVSTGAHTSGPMCLIGKLLGARIVFIETAASITSPSKTGRYVYHFADTFIVQDPEMLKVFPRAIYRGSLLP